MNAKQNQASFCNVAAFSAVSDGVNAQPLHPVIKHGKWGFMNNRTSGQGQVHDLRFEVMDGYRNGLVGLRVGGRLGIDCRWGWIDETGSFVWDPAG